MSKRRASSTLFKRFTLDPKLHWVASAGVACASSTRPRRPICLYGGSVPVRQAVTVCVEGEASLGEAMGL